MTLTRNSKSIRSRGGGRKMATMKKHELRLYLARIKGVLIIGMISLLLIFQISKLNEFAIRFNDDTNNNADIEDTWHAVHSVPESKIDLKIPVAPSSKRKESNKKKSKAGISVDNRLTGALRNILDISNSGTMPTTVGLCALLKHDEKYVNEWIDYNLGIGFDNIYIYDNSKSNVLKNLRSRNDSRVKVIPWPYTIGNQDIKSRRNCLHVEGKNHAWMALFHGNEFLVLKNHENINNLLSEYNNVGTLVSNRYIFGPANRIKYEPMPVTFRFMNRAPNLYIRIKNIVNMNMFRSKKNYSGEQNIPLHFAVVHQYAKSVSEYMQYGCSISKPNIDLTRCPSMDKFERELSVYDDSAWALLKNKVPKYEKNEKKYIQLINETAAICVLMKAEELYVDEWVDYNIGLGFDRIYIYDNSDNNTMKEWGEKRSKDVEVIHWPGLKRQMRSQVHCLNQLPKHTWMGLFDGDEFLVLKKHNNVVDFLKEHCKRGSIAINWSIFGTGNKTLYEPLPVTKRFLYRETNISSTIKSIIRMDDFDPKQKIKNPHSFPVRKGTMQHDTDGKSNFSIAGAAHQEGGPTDVALLHHYRYKSLEEWRYKGCVRKMAANSSKQCDWPAVNGTTYDDSAWLTLMKNVPKYKELYDAT